jgi:hypothetical protein
LEVGISEGFFCVFETPEYELVPGVGAGVLCPCSSGVLGNQWPGAHLPTCVTGDECELSICAKQECGHQFPGSHGSCPSASHLLLSPVTGSHLPAPCLSCRGWMGYRFFLCALSLGSCSSSAISHGLPQVGLKAWSCFAGLNQKAPTFVEPNSIRTATFCSYLLCCTFCLQHMTSLVPLSPCEPCQALLGLT